MSACAAAAGVASGAVATRCLVVRRSTLAPRCAHARLGAQRAGWASSAQPLARASTARTAVRARASKPSTRAFWQANREKAARLAAELRTHGTAGVLAYGLLNTAYYSTAFVVVWTYVLKVPTGLGTAAAARRVLEVLPIVWAGSQVTKLPRFGGALLLAPVASKLLEAVEARLPQKSRSLAFTLLVLGCLCAAAALFGGIVLLWS
jgi:hypothetical protein